MRCRHGSNPLPPAHLHTARELEVARMLGACSGAGRRRTASDPRVERTPRQYAHRHVRHLFIFVTQRALSVSNSELLASPSELIASPSELLASPSEL
jgi:hypothetical protein